MTASRIHWAGWVGAAVATTAMAKLMHACFSATSTFWGPVISRGCANDRNEIALTFDDGPTEGPTEAILDVLRKHGAIATFFIIGRHALRWPELVRRMADEGHVIANHSFDHSHYGAIRSAAYWNDQMRRTDDAIAAAIGRTPALFRPPMGIRTARIARAARATGHHIVTWSLRAVDGVSSTTPKRIVERVGVPARGGDIIVLHDGINPHHHRDPAATIAALPTLLDLWKQRSLSLVTLDQLAGVNAYRHPCETTSVNESESSRSQLTSPCSAQ